MPVVDATRGIRRPTTTGSQRSRRTTVKERSGRWGLDSELLLDSAARRVRAAAPGGPLLNLSLDRIVPHHVMTGLRRWEFEAKVHAGWWWAESTSRPPPSWSDLRSRRACGDHIPADTGRNGRGPRGHNASFGSQRNGSRGYGDRGSPWPGGSFRAAYKVSPRLGRTKSPVSASITHSSPSEMSNQAPCSASRPFSSRIRTQGKVRRFWIW